METIGERIKRRRKELNMSVDKLSELLGKNRATVYRYESDEIENMPTTILEPLAKVLQTTPAYLMGWDDEEENIFKKNLDFLIQKNKTNAPSLSEQTGISVTRLNILLCGKDDPNMSELKSIANRFNVTNTQLLKGRLYEDAGSCTLTEREKNILDMIKSLNDDGVKKVEEYIVDLSDKYLRD